MLYGYGGTILRIDLSSGSVKKEPTPEKLAKEWLGGRGFVSKILFDEVLPEVEPFSAENKVVIASGPLSGMFMPSSGKIEMGTKSPATGGYGDSNMGGHLAQELKYAGYDAIILEGVSEKPVYIYIDDDTVQIRDASKYWGMGSFEAEKTMLDDLGEDFRVATIGPAGENMVRFACINHDFGRQAGRTGVGAVWGHKKVKALAMRGSKAIKVAEPIKAYEKGKEMYQEVFKNPAFIDWTPEGTAGVTNWINEAGAFPTKNFSTSYFADHEQINGAAIRNEILVTDKGCFACPIPCGKYSKGKVKDKEFHVEGPEYEAISLLGGNLALGNIHEVAYANYLCDDLGLDTISAGAVASWAIEAYEKGILTKEEVGMDLNWGDIDSAELLIKAMAKREGIGEILAEGVKIAAEKVGQDSDKFAIHTKGLEWSGYESRNAPAMALAYMTADIGAHHNRAWAITYDIAVGFDVIEGKAEKVIELQHVRPLFDTLGICRFPWVELSFDLKHYEDLFPLVTGWDYSWDELLKISEKIYNLNRAFNYRHIPGFGRDMDNVPKKFMEEVIPDGPSEGKKITPELRDALLDRYYAVRGWDNNGRPTREKLTELGIPEVADILEV